MATAVTTENARHADTALQLLDQMLGDHQPLDFAVRLWDGREWGPGPGQEARFKLVVRDPSAIRRIVDDFHSITVGEAYIFDDIDVEGDVEHMFTVGERLLANPPSVVTTARAAGKLLTLPSPKRHGSRRAAEFGGSSHSKRRDRQAVTFHYDVGNDFYSLWLGDRMVYSCAYFKDPEEDLNAAQERKLDLICRKLRLKPGERLLDLGCGWGGLIIHAAREYGVDAHGITLSEPQARLANERAAQAGIAGRCRAEVRDYREVKDWGSYDKLVSVGMFEHVGEAKLQEYFQRAYSLLRPGGAFLNHGISRSPIRAAGTSPMFQEPGPSFFDRYVFPDGELVPVSETLTAAEGAGFDVRDLESLREHYAITLRHWVANLEENRDKACACANDVNYRIWRAFMAASAFGFESGYISVFQALMVRADRGRSGLPLSREDWYSR